MWFWSTINRGFYGKAYYTMTIKIFPFENYINFSEKCFNTLEILNKKLFINIIESLYSECEGEEAIERICIFENEKQIDFTKNVIIVSDILRYDLNDRKILNKLYENLAEVLEYNEEFKNELLKLQFAINEKIEILLNDFEFETIYKEEYLLQDYLKMVGLKVSFTKPRSFLNRMYLILDITRELLGNKVIIFVNCKNYYQENELIEIVKYVNYNKNKVLFIENSKGTKIPGEFKEIIDEEYEEFIVEV